MTRCRPVERKKCKKVPREGVENRIQKTCLPFQVCSLTQFNSVGFLGSKISLKRVIFTNTIMICNFCFELCPGISDISEITHEARLRALEGHCVSSKKTLQGSANQTRELLEERKRIVFP